MCREHTSYLRTYTLINIMFMSFGPSTVFTICFFINQRENKINRVGRDREFRIGRYLETVRIHSKCTPKSKCLDVSASGATMFSLHTQFFFFFFKRHLYSHLFESSRRRKQTTKSKLEIVWTFSKVVFDFAPSAFLQLVVV